MKTCTCGHLDDEHEWHPGPVECQVEDCPCIHFEEDFDEDEEEQ